MQNALKYYKIRIKIVGNIHKTTPERAEKRQTFCNDWTEKKIYVIIATSGKRNNI